ncbi:hypothetical protein UA08_02185 [Talaromyces atroroseus]|uniref:Knr4/Smi1-like domain-containing protein n=1 Tax=Talaromyces atroroseus TaxID=1441469 RepID=A0A225ASM0_TALAT|nr:hypothetical protein UA08_02185 [Talaromyces atroroseus]OKL62503.1 hypothetical protein UA08_02185 [Talaromyces atroroseus]
MDRKMLTWLVALLIALSIPFLSRQLKSSWKYLRNTARMDQLSEAQKSRLDEVANLMLEIYETLAKMRYIDPAGIKEGPHDTSSLQSQYEEYGLDPTIKYLYSILPYIDAAAAGNSDFLHGGEFANFLDPEQVEQGRDPFYASPEGDDFEAENGPYMRPWVTALSQLGNHGSVILYDAKSHQIWIIDQESWASTDLALEGMQTKEITSVNDNSFDHIPGRPARDVLRDINGWYRSLEALPGGGERSWLDWDHWDEILGLKGLYQRNGWPDDLDGDSFEIGRARGYAASRAKWFAEEPLRQVEKYQLWKKFGEDRKKAAMNEATSMEDEWVAQFTVWKQNRNLAQHIKRLRESKDIAERLCPNGVCQKREDLPLWELEFLQKEHQDKQDDLSRSRDMIEQYKDNKNDLSGGEEEEEKMAKIELNHAIKTESIYRRAVVQAKADADRLCPGKTLQSALGINADDLYSRHHLQEQPNLIQREIEALQEWLVTVPSDVVKAKEMALNEISKFESFRTKPSDG